MTNEEAKFLLSGYRPNGADAGDAALAEALAQTRRDPALGAWWERSQAMDRVVAAKLDEVRAPAGLRASLVAGARVTAPRVAWWQRPSMWGVAAALAVMAAVAMGWRVQDERAGAEAALPLAVWEQAVRADLAAGFVTTAYGAEMGEFGTWLGEATTRFAVSEGPPLDPALLRRRGCRVVEVGEREVWQICFQRSDTGAVYHVYVSPRGEVDARGLGRAPRVEASGEMGIAMWQDGAHVYLLASGAGMDAVQNVL